MRRLQVLLASAVVAATTCFVAAPAQAYPDPIIDVEVGVAKVLGGDPVRVAVKADVTCASLTLSMLGQTVEVTSKGSLTHTFDTDEVSEPTDTNVTATCRYDDGGSDNGSGGGSDNGSGGGSDNGSGGGSDNGSGGGSDNGSGGGSDNGSGGGSDNGSGGGSDNGSGGGSDNGSGGGSDNGSGGGSVSDPGSVSAVQSVSRNVVITRLPRAAAADHPSALAGVLPDTGGLRLTLLVIAVALLAAGSALMVRRRRQA